MQDLQLRIDANSRLCEDEDDDEREDDFSCGSAALQRQS